MKPSHLRTLASLIVFGAATMSSAPLSAAEINLTRIDPEDNGPDDFTGAGNLDDVVSAAARVWEQTLGGDQATSVKYQWRGGLLAPELARFNSLTNTLTFNSDRTDWFVDGTPELNEEFRFFTTSTSDFGGGPLGTQRNMTRAVAPVVQYDLLSLAVHELGHALGFDTFNLETFGSNELTINDPLPFSGSQLPIERFEGHFDLDGPLDQAVMTARPGIGQRYIPSAADILAVAEVSEIEAVELGALVTTGETFVRETVFDDGSGPFTTKAFGGSFGDLDIGGESFSGTGEIDLSGRVRQIIGGERSGIHLIDGVEVIADGLQSEGDVSIEGAGTKLVLQRPTLGSGSLQIAEKGVVSGGARVDAYKLNIGRDATLEVTGLGTEVSLIGGYINGNTSVAGSLNIKSGALFTTTGDVLGVGSAPRISVRGEGSRLVSERNVFASFGSSVNGVIEVLEGGALIGDFVSTNPTDPIFSPGKIIVSGEGSLVESVVGELGVTGGQLSVSDAGIARASTIRVGAGGVLSGDGGTIDGTVVVDGGRIAPGASPGRMTITGDFIMLEGLLEFEFAGSAPGEFDVIEILGDFLAPDPFTLSLSFLDGYVPFAEQGFDIFEIAGATGDFEAMLAASMLNVETHGLPNGFGFELGFENGVLSAKAKDISNAKDISAVPLPASFALFLSALAGLAFFRRGTAITAARRCGDIEAP